MKTTDNDWKHSKSICMKMSADPTDASSNGEYSTCLETSDSFSRQKRQCRSSSPIAAQPVAAVSTTTASSNEKTIYDVPDAVLALSFAFVGKGTFRYTASVCKTFHKVYKSAFHDTTDTSIGSAVATIACAEMFLEEKMEDWRLILGLKLGLGSFVIFGMEQQDMDAWKF
jgi:hypothetical protein